MLNFRSVIGFENRIFVEQELLTLLIFAMAIDQLLNPNHDFIVAISHRVIQTNLGLGIVIGRFCPFAWHPPYGFGVDVDPG